MKWRYALLSVFLCVRPGWALTLSDLLTQTRLFLKDTATSAGRQRYSDTQLTSFLNNAQKEVNARTFAVVRSSSFPLMAGTTEYSMPADNITILRVTRDFTPLSERTLSALDDAQTSWIYDSSGTPDHYYVRVSSSLVDGVSKESIGFIPLSTGPAVVTLEYLAQPTDLAGITDVPFGSDNIRFLPFHHALAYRAAYFGYLINGDLQSASVYLKEYEDLVRTLESLTMNRLLFNPNFRGNLSKSMEAKQ